MKEIYPQIKKDCLRLCPASVDKTFLLFIHSN